MKYSFLGPTGVEVSQICLGTATFGVAPNAEDAERVVDAALDLGINFFDTANVYGTLSVFDQPGASADREPAEQILGRALSGRRDDVVIATKSGERRLAQGAGLSRRHIIQQVENSLRRLRTDYIDLYYAHFPDPNTPLEQTLWIADDRRLHAPVCAQVRYSLIDRSAEQELAPAAQQFGLSTVAYSPLHGGLLAGSRVLEREIHGWQRFSGSGFSERELEIGRAVERLSQEWGLQPHEISLAWLLSRPTVASAIVGAETVEEITANAADIVLEPEQLEALTNLESTALQVG
jgi:aryl-alcohol dehydrogenase-like predicted oxidoreductase